MTNTEWHREYRRKHRKECREKARLYYLKNRKILKAKRKQYYQAHKKRWFDLSKLWKKNAKLRCLDFLGGRRCCRCLYDKCVKALHFHHRNPRFKKFEIADAFRNKRPWSEIKRELKKCEVLCANCHAEVGWGLH